MGTTFAVVIAAGLLAQAPHGPNCRCYPQPGGRITPPGPGYGWGFPNNSPDGYGWVDYGTTLPLGADRTPDYYFRRQYALPIQQVMLPTYWNPYVMRGQRYIPWTGCGGAHPAGGPPTSSAIAPMHPYQDNVAAARARAAEIQAPRFSGRTELAPPLPTESPRGR